MSLELNSLTRKRISTDLIALDYDELDVSGRIVRYVATDIHSVKRSRSLLTKEPLTVPWISTFEPGDVYVDVGANVGMYAIYAGVHGARVFAFEPEALNYAELNKNIFVNDLHGQVTAYCAAISDQADVSVLHLSGFSVAYSHHDFGENRWSGDMTFGKIALERDKRPQQGCVSFALDDLVARGKLPAPNHLKIDVDGFEWKVIKGARQLLASERLRTVLLEVDFAIPESVALIDELTAMGWLYSPDQVRLNQHAIFPFEKIESLKRRGKGGANYIFFRDEAFYMSFFRRFAETFVPPNPLPRPTPAVTG
jgi:FkbM family methyltransferase